MTKIQVRKQFTTRAIVLSIGQPLFSIWRRYKFESNSQRKCRSTLCALCCFQYDEDTSSKAIHNLHRRHILLWCVVFNMTKIQVRKQFTTLSVVTPRVSALFSIWRRYKFESNSQRTCCWCRLPACCFQYDEDTSSKAIHNSCLVSLSSH